MEQTNFYENTQYSFERTERKTLILDCKLEDTITEISLPLYEPLIIDKLSDVYLDSFTTFDALANTNVEKAAFVVNINEFNIKSNSNHYNNLAGTAVMNTFNKLVIPNEATSTSKTFVHKSKKMNYICTMNPTKLSTLTIKITDLNSTPATMFSKTAGRFIIEFVIIAR